MSHLNLPGYLFDATRNRYFRVVQNGNAAMSPDSDSGSEFDLSPLPHSIAQYTSSEVARTKRQEQLELNKVDEPVQVLPSSCRTMLMPTSGSFKYEVQADYWIHARHCGDIPKMTALRRPLQRAMDLAAMESEMQIGGQTQAGISGLVYNETIKLILLGCKDGTVVSFNADNLRGSYSCDKKLVVDLKSPVSCIDVKDDLIAASSLGGVNMPAAWKIMRVNGTGPGRSFEVLGEDRSAAESCFGCALYYPGPTKEENGSSMHLALCLQKEIRFSSYSKRVKSIKTNSDPLALAALHDLHLVAVGFRNGVVFMFDTKDPQYKVVTRFKHGSTVTGIQVVCGHYIVVAGLSDNLKLYDIRYSKTKPNAPPTIVTVLDYAQFRNEYTPHTPMSISSDGSLLAVTCGDGKVQIYDTWTGRLFKSTLTNERKEITGVAWRPYGLAVSTEKTVFFHCWRKTGQ